MAKEKKKRYTITKETDALRHDYAVRISLVGGHVKAGSMICFLFNIFDTKQPLKKYVR